VYHYYKDDYLLDNLSRLLSIYREEVFNMDNNDKFCCPHCGSDNTNPIPLVYERGYASSSTTHTITDLAARLAPPELPIKPVPAKINSGILLAERLILIIIFIKLTSLYDSLPLEHFMIISFVLLTLIYLLSRFFIEKKLSIWTNITRDYELALQSYNKDLSTYHEKFNAWKKSYICMRCSHIFILDDIR